MFYIVIIFFLYFKHVHCEYEGEYENAIPVSKRSKNDIPRTTEGNNVPENSLRESRFLTFNNDRSNIRVEAVFAIPILAIPIGGKEVTDHHSNLGFPTIDVNLKSIISITAIFVLLFFIIPKLVQTYLPFKLTSPVSNQPYDSTEVIGSLMRRVYDALEKHNVDVESCARKAVCWTFNNSATKVKQGKATGLDKLLDAVSSMPYLKYLFENTWLWSILENGMHFSDEGNRTCRKFNEKCSITQNRLNIATRSVLASIREQKS